MTLERILKKSKKTLNWYGGTIKENYKQFIPPLIVSAVGAYAGQDFAEFTIENPSEWMLQVSGYVGASIGGYSSFLSLEYNNKKEKYPNGFLSREMGKTFLDIASADYIADLISFTPVFVAVNHYLLNKGIDAGSSGSISTSIGSITYFFTMCALYDRMQVLTQSANNTFKKIGKSVNNLLNTKKNIL